MILPRDIIQPHGAHPLRQGFGGLILKKRWCQCLSHGVIIP